jgi:hypothetical protein
MFRARAATETNLPAKTMTDFATLSAAVATVLTALPPMHFPPEHELYEPPEARSERMVTLGRAIAATAQRATCTGAWRTEECTRKWPGSATQLAAIVGGIGFLESANAWHVHAGKCRIRIGECDGGRARTVFQMQRTSYTTTVWDELEGVDEQSTVLAAWAATRAVSGARAACARTAPDEPWLSATLAMYGTGQRCSSKNAPKRAAFIVRLESKLRVALAPPD